MLKEEWFSGRRLFTVESLCVSSSRLLETTLGRVGTGNFLGTELNLYYITKRLLWFCWWIPFSSSRIRDSGTIFSFEFTISFFVLLLYLYHSFLRHWIAFLCWLLTIWGRKKVISENWKVPLNFSIFMWVIIFVIFYITIVSFFPPPEKTFQSCFDIPSIWGVIFRVILFIFPWLFCVFFIKIYSYLKAFSSSMILTFICSFEIVSFFPLFAAVKIILIHFTIFPLSSIYLELHSTFCPPFLLPILHLYHILYYS